ncbi:hypothetical protein MGN01_09050 [Methylobacterium gnaphalii]|uniref:Uncharacterized protein n=1 Tax=Methylobacterium gnaphalii TaxID=1010610 RepID=A0A512JGH4_9HYPH|nr:hypothetical protein MGN01_09050 [Methylobacterium gnaphalii]GLS48984.1 hypothetical protein GCM10007885_18310 [Methylobacterium gnaphalii]
MQPYKVGSVAPVSSVMRSNALTAGRDARSRLQAWSAEMPFIITGTSLSGPRTATRLSPASAIVLAMKWDEEGLRDIQIAPPDAAPQCFRAFQAQLHGASRSGAWRRQNPPVPR